MPTTYTKKDGTKVKYNYYKKRKSKPLTQNQKKIIRFFRTEIRDMDDDILKDIVKEIDEGNKILIMGFL